LGYLYHGLFSSLKGTKKKDHKYISRSGTSGNYKYVYPTDTKTSKTTTASTVTKKSTVANPKGVAITPTSKTSAKIGTATGVVAKQNEAVKMDLPASKKSSSLEGMNHVVPPRSGVTFAFSYSDLYEPADPGPVSTYTDPAGSGKTCEAVENALPRKTTTMNRDQDMVATNPNRTYSQSMIDTANELYAQTDVAIDKVNRNYVNWLAELCVLNPALSEYIEFSDDGFAYVAKDSGPHATLEVAEALGYSYMVTNQYRSDYSELEKIYDKAYATEDKVEAYLTNCMWCSATYDLRRRGYDVTAAPNGVVNLDYQGNAEELYDYYEDPQVFVPDAGSVDEVAKMIADEIRSYPIDSYGMFNVFWIGGGGHSMIFENYGGTPIIRCTQTNHVYTVKQVLEMVPTSEYGSIMICRTDNLNLKEGILECVTTTTNWNDAMAERRTS